jgi:phosphate transport system substrate-binding protein
MGYVELNYALLYKITYGQVRNAAGNFITANRASIDEAAASAAQAMPSDFRVSITNSAGAKSYPISTFTWILVPEQMEPAKKDAMKTFLRWALNVGQDYAESAGYTRLPDAVLQKELKAIDEMR